MKTGKHIFVFAMIFGTAAALGIAAAMLLQPPATTGHDIARPDDSQCSMAPDGVDCACYLRKTRHILSDDTLAMLNARSADRRSLARFQAVSSCS